MASRCRNRSLPDDSKPMAILCLSPTLVACRRPSSTCCRRSRTFSMEGWGATVSSNSPACGGRAPESGRPAPQPDRWMLISPHCSRVVLAVFDGTPGNFNIQRVQDELIGQMADLLGVVYDTLALEIVDSEKRWQILTSEPVAAPTATPSVATSPQTAPTQLSPPDTHSAANW